MPIVLYRRHGRDCPTRDPKKPESKLNARAKRAYLGCSCPVWVDGRLPDGRKIDRQSCHTRDLEEARRLIVALNPPGFATTPEPNTPAPDRGPRLAHSIIQYLERREHEIREETRFYYKLILGWLRAFAEKQGIVYIRDLSVELLERFKFEGMPKLADSTRGVYTAKLRAFLKEAERLGWIEKRLADRVRPHRSAQEPTLPFSETEIAALLDEAEPIYRLLFELMLETGLRISDAMRFDPSRLVQGERLWIYPFQMTKRKRLAKGTGIHFETFLSLPLKTRIDRARGKGLWISESFPFREARNTRRAVYIRVYREMQRVGEVRGIEDCRPHRLRDTFAVRKLLAGVSLDDVSRLLGHASVSMTEEAYAAWIPARARRLEHLVADSLVQPPLVNHLNRAQGNAQRKPATRSVQSQNTRLIQKPRLDRVR